jgi:glycosyltransferase involved in cell wall biosynthesis
MIAGSEERRIGPALDSVKGWAAEIIVVINDNVKDRTEQLCRDAGAKVFREPWKGHVEQKNSAAAKATQPWLFGLDSDEALTPELKEELSEILRNAPADVAGFSVPRLSSYLGRWIRHGDWYPDRKVRIWRAGMARWVGDNPHDRLSVDGSVHPLRNDLLHRPMESIDHQIRKTVEYADIFAENAVRDGKKAGVAEIVARPVFRFFRCYILKLGFLDGWQGFVIAWMVAFYTFLRYTKVKIAEESKSPGS